ncbi:hypothetical protein [Sphingomonas beigongshangi]|uniref:hypothetical protein n=1 Tax=Sphingomonas beigongshangi TaxID=2782540 RepID=UPI00193B2368|nr:hypothetical protein [Sphingomonas beigongshangi]
MIWINQLDLKNWAGRIGAREDFPVMVRDLILASARDIGDIKHMRFPGGESSQVRGYDGDLTIAVGTTYVPAGRSIWEFGVGADAIEKFESDYDKRAKSMAKTDRAQTTFVFVTPRNWDNPKKKLPDYIKEFQDKKEFKDVRFVDGAALETWLGIHGAVGAKYARTVLERVPQKGARSTDEFWAEYSARFHPRLTEAVALCARNEQAASIVSHLMGKGGQMIFVGDGPDEVSAVAVAAIRTAPELDRKFLEARTLIVDTDEAGREVAVADRYGYVVSPSVEKVTGTLGSYGPVVATVDFLPPAGRHPRLERPSTREMSEALRTMGLGEEEAEALARKSGRSLTILERHAPAAGAKRPDWANGAASLIPALLAGGWDSRQEGDQRILSDLSGLDYDDFEAGMRAYLSRLDAPLDQRSGLWKLRAPVDAFVNLSHLVTRKHLTGLATAATAVFTTDDPPNIGAERLGTSDAPYSSTLREGLATTLLILAAMHQEVGLESIDDPASFVESVVANLPGLRDDPRVVIGLERQLTHLMEASPRPLLEALEHLLEGEAPLASLVFAETSDYGISRTRLPNLMWALEMQAWDPVYLRQVALLLGKLASLDPGGTAGNRPIASLRDIFVAWSPGTNASLAERLAVIDEVISIYPETGWQLVVALLPKLYDTKGPTQRPLFREAGASEREPVTYAIVGDTYDAMTDRALSLVGDDPTRWNEVAEAFPRFSPERRVQFLEMLTGRVASIMGEERNELRRTLTRIADRHERFREAEWALPNAALSRLKRIVGSLRSDDPFDKARALFDEANPYAERDYVAAERAIAQRRADSVSALASTGGAGAILRLAETIRFPKLAALAAATGIQDRAVIDDLLSAGDPHAPAPELSSALSGNLRHLRGETFGDDIARLAASHSWSPIRTASMLLHWPEKATTWDAVDALGDEASRWFWSHREPMRFEGPTSDLETLVGRFIAADRAGAALMAVHPRESELSWATVATLLGGRIAEINRGGIVGEMDGFYVSELFKSLRRREDVNKLDLARWEYAYFPLLEHHEERLELFDRMAKDPEFFVSILKDVYISDDAQGGESETSETQRLRGTISHRILLANDAVPGATGGVIDQSSLDAWVDGMLEEGRTAKLTKVVPAYIGRTIAHAAQIDGVWPPAPVASVIERLRSHEVEHSIMIERLNMRGVYTKVMFEGGPQERDLAARYRSWARAHAASPRTCAMLTAIARRWDEDAKRADTEAEQDRLRFS